MSSTMEWYETSEGKRKYTQDTKTLRKKEKHISNEEHFLWEREKIGIHRLDSILKPREEKRKQIDGKSIKQWHFPDYSLSHPVGSLLWWDVTSGDLRVSPDRVYWMYKTYMSRSSDQLWVNYDEWRAVRIGDGWNCCTDMTSSSNSSCPSNVCGCYSDHLRVCDHFPERAISSRSPPHRPI